MSPVLGMPPTLVRFDLARGGRKSVAHRIALALVWLTIAVSSIVYTEPAPVDALTIGLMLLLPIVGLVDAKPMLWAGFAVVFTMTACGELSAALARETGIAVSHMNVSLYLVGAWFLFAAFIAKRPKEHTRLILNAYLLAGIIAALCGIAGYLSLFPGAFDHFTRYGRASGPFKDPNVFGPFLIAPLLLSLHLWLVRPLRRGILPLISAAILAVGILFSFSRGAWAATAIGLLIFCYVYTITVKTNRERLKLAALLLLGALTLAMILAAALQSSAISDLLEQRASLTQSYDVGPDGRFGGQRKAVGLILENPLGIGSAIFTRFYHHEEVHNIYLSMFLNAGWVGGLLYLMTCLGTLVLGLRHAFKRTETSPYFLIAFAALAGNICEGVLIDSDHWRHFYLLLALVWGMMAADQYEFAGRPARMLRDLRPILLRSVLLIPPSRRHARILAVRRKIDVQKLRTRVLGKIPGWRPGRGRIIAPA
ncbi:MAG TPA: O-antigen ligase family protein [Hyphomicrobium sp.]|nr:O-antigen ligase family protein [Hyphomicrobium sp.]